MKTKVAIPLSQRYNHTPAVPSGTNAIQQYYEIAGPDYVTWSSNFNMHFGYYKRFSDLFSLEKMLVNMNDQVLSQLNIDPKTNAQIADLGCGMGTVARHIAKKLPLASLTAITIVDYQVKTGKDLNRKAGLENRVHIMKGNFEDIDHPGNSFTHAYALESACHSSGAAKEPFIAEMARILKTGGRFCIADGFLKNNRKKPRLFNWLYKKIAKYWAVPGFAVIGEFTDRLKEFGLHDISVREISYRIAPSVMYVPFKCAKFFFTEIVRNRSLRMKKERWHNVYAPLLGMFIGLFRNHFGYYIISGRK